MTTLAKKLHSLISNVLKPVVTDTHYLKPLEIMNNPWTRAYTHRNFYRFSIEEIDEMLICELEEIYNYE
jgi:hypothetical protein